MKNWKTSLFGCLAAIAGLMIPVFPEYEKVFATLTAVFGGLFAFFSKDNNVTGGTIQQ